jgi:uncharacterized protein involved in oxidation of intracellular sulfur
MKIGIVISTNDPETCWNALRFGNFCLEQEEEVRIFLIGMGVECEKKTTDKFNTIEQMQKFLQGKGLIFACGTCLKSRDQSESNLCPLNTLKDLYDIVKESDKILTF